MIDEEEDTGGKIDWTIAIVLSVAFHAAILGAVWFFSDHPGDAKAVDEGKTEEVAKTTEPDAPDGGEASGRSDEDESEGPEVATTATTAERPTTPAARPRRARPRVRRRLRLPPTVRRPSSARLLRVRRGPERTRSRGATSFPASRTSADAPSRSSRSSTASRTPTTSIRDRS